MEGNDLQFPEIDVTLSTEEFEKLEKGAPTEPTQPSGGEAIPEGGDELATNTYNIWVEKGLIPQIEDFDGTWESLEKLTEDIPNVITGAIIDNAPELGKDVLRYVFSLGDDLTKEALTEYVQAFVESRDEGPAEINSVEQARAFLKNVYGQSINDEDVVEATLDALEDKGDDHILNVASNERKKVLDARTNRTAEIEKTRLEQKRALDQQRQQFIQDFHTNVQETGWATNRQNKLITEYSKGVTKQKFDLAASNPKSLVQLVNFLSYFDPKKGEFDFDDFVNQLQTKETKSLKDKIIGDNFKSSNSKGTFRVLQGKRPTTEDILKKYKPID